VSARVVQAAISALVDGGARQGQIRLDTRTLRWIEVGSGEPVVVAGAGLGEPGSLAFAGVLRELAATTRVVAYDRAGLGESDPVAELSLDQELGDLARVVAAAGRGPCVLVGHSWGGLLALLAAVLDPHTVCGLVLVDSADERFWQSAPPAAHREEEENCRALIEQHAGGELAAKIRDEFEPFARTLTADPRTRALFLDAYVSCYATASQASIVLDEFRMALGAIAQISAIRSEYPPPDVPLIVLSATTGQPAAQRRAWTDRHADLAARAPRGTHTILPNTGHAIHPERPDEVAAAIARVVHRARAERQDTPSRTS
jgi:pimeloyl-ACP methyl ester carboxylesterase